MLVALLVLMFFVNEPKLVSEQLEYEKSHPETTQTLVEEGGTIPKDVKKSLSFLLVHDISLKNTQI